MRKIIILFILFYTFYNLNCQTQPKGHLVIIGGGPIPDYIYNRIIELAGDIGAKIVIIPCASGEPNKSASAIMERFQTFGAKNTDFIICDSLSDNTIDNAKVIFFTGGDQNLLTKYLLGTRLFNKIKNLYENGAIIVGTSAGAAAMSEIMITGNELKNKDTTNNFNSICSNNIETSIGFGFLSNVIIDQHFIKRKRINRLISVILENPSKLGIGIDESTAIIVNPDNTFEVIGENQVILIDATDVNYIKTNDNGNFGSSNLLIHILLNGDKFNLNSKTKISE